jgi:cobalt-zinc-cadmium efflux system membrane fusion protein
MNSFSYILSRLGAVIVVGAVGVCMVGAVVWVRSNAKAAGEQTSEEDNGTRLVDPHTVEISAELAHKWGVDPQPVQTAAQLELKRPLPPLSGSLALDITKLARVHSRFPGEIMEIGTKVCDDKGNPVKGSDLLRDGDFVKAGQLLAVVWCKDLGEKKNDLLTALIQLRLSERKYDRNVPLLKTGGISSAALDELWQTVRANQAAVERVEQTLRTWLVPEEDIDKVRALGEKWAQWDEEKLERKTKPDPTWARVEVRAKFAGKMLERNINVGDIIDTTTDLFKVQDLSQLAIWAHIYEDDLPTLLKLQKARGKVEWQIQLRADPDAKPVTGTIEKIGEVIDPNTHTALLFGYIDNKDGSLRAGQFITATILMPPSPNELAVPTTALVGMDGRNYVFVQPDSTKPRFALRRVEVVRETSDWIYVRLAAGPGGQGKGPPLLRPGERVVAAGSQGLLQDYESLTVKSRGTRDAE